MLLLGGSAVINALTGMNIYAASFLIPLGIILYTAIGGLKATFMSSYIHTVRPGPRRCCTNLPECHCANVPWSVQFHACLRRRVEGSRSTRA